MRQEAKQNLQIWTGMALRDAGQFSLGTRMRRESVIRPSRRTSPLVNGPAVCSVLVVLASCVLLTAQNVVLTGALDGRVTISVEHRCWEHPSLCRISRPG